MQLILFQRQEDSQSPIASTLRMLPILPEAAYSSRQRGRQDRSLCYRSGAAGKVPGRVAEELYVYSWEGLFLDIAERPGWVRLLCRREIHTGFSSII